MIGAAADSAQSWGFVTVRPIAIGVQKKRPGKPGRSHCNLTGG
jgi:hypothetical protein